MQPHLNEKWARMGVPQGALKDPVEVLNQMAKAGQWQAFTISGNGLHYWEEINDGDTLLVCMGQTPRIGDLVVLRTETATGFRCERYRGKGQHGVNSGRTLEEIAPGVDWDVVGVVAKVLKTVSPAP